MLYQFSVNPELISIYNNNDKFSLIKQIIPN